MAEPDFEAETGLAYRDRLIAAVCCQGVVTVAVRGRRSQCAIEHDLRTPGGRVARISRIEEGCAEPTQQSAEGGV